MSQATLPSPAGAAPAPRFVVGLDVGSETCLVAVLTPDKRVVRKPFAIANARDGFAHLDQQLTQLGCAPHEILVGLEATGRYWETVHYFLHQRGYRLVLLHPAQTHHFAQRRGLRAKTDKLDAVTIARALLSDDVRPAYVPNELTATYRELVRLHSNLSDEVARYKNEIRDLLVVLSRVHPGFKGPHTQDCLSGAACLSECPSHRSRREFHPLQPSLRRRHHAIMVRRQPST